MNKLFFVLLMLNLQAYAAPYTPTSGDDIIAHWAAPTNDELGSIKTAARLKPNDPATIVAIANSYLAQAAQPGQSRFYGLAQAALKPLIEQNLADKNVWLVWAQVQQYQHNFAIAQDAIAKVLNEDPSNENANVLAARIYIIQEQYLAARNSCLKLLGSADLLTVTACSLEANSYLNPNDLKNSYEQLAKLVKAQGLPKDERAAWLIQLLADFAIRSDDPTSAATWLAQGLDNANVNYLVQWADAQLALNNNDAVLTQLTSIVTAAPEMDDTLLMRLALAEKKLNQKNHWQGLLTERVQLREQRQDSLHASELALYYLDINPNSQKALYWAKTNFANAREYNDKKLLARAEQANQEKGI